MFILFCRFRPLTAVLVAAVACTALFRLPAKADDAKPEEEPPATTQAAKDRPAQKAMRKLASEVELKALASEGSEARPLKLRPEPVMSYGDETRFIKDSTLWVWMDGDRPAMFQKLEINDWVAGSPLWTWCFASALPGTVEGRWPGVTNGIQTKDAVEWKPIPDAVVGEKSTAWPLEARSLNRRFTAEDGPNALRAVARPLLEFKSPDQGVPYGAVFSHARGTNPDFLLILQVESLPNGGRRWTYAPIHMTSATLTVKLDGKEVWNDPAQKPAEVSSWGYFFTPRDPAIK
jgi:hypothetical protein